MRDRMLRAHTREMRLAEVALGAQLREYETDERMRPYRRAAAVLADMIRLGWAQDHGWREEDIPDLLPRICRFGVNGNGAAHVAGAR